MQSFTWGPWTYRLTFSVPPSPSRQITSEQDPRWQPGAVSKISQGIKSKAQSDNLHGAAVLGQRFKLPLPAAPPHGYQGNQTQKSSLLKTRRLYLQHPQRVTRRRSSCRTCCCLWDSLQCYSPLDGLTVRSWLFTLGLQEQPCQDLLNLNI